MTLQWNRDRHLVSYAYWGPFGIEWGDGIILRAGRCWFAFRVKVGRA